MERNELIGSMERSTALRVGSVVAEEIYEGDVGVEEESEDDWQRHEISEYRDDLNEEGTNRRWE